VRTFPCWQVQEVLNPDVQIERGRVDPVASGPVHDTRLLAVQDADLTGFPVAIDECELAFEGAVVGGHGASFTLAVSGSTTRRAMALKRIV